MFAATGVIAGFRIANVIILGRFDPTTVLAGADPYGSDFAQLHGVRVHAGAQSLDQCLALQAVCRACWLLLTDKYPSVRSCCLCARRQNSKRAATPHALPPTPLHLALQISRSHAWLQVASRVNAERALTAFLAFCVWLRAFKYARAVPVFGTLGRTLTRAFPSVRRPQLYIVALHCRW